jgi:hypothetical protein
MVKRHHFALAQPGVKRRKLFPMKVVTGRAPVRVIQHVDGLDPELGAEAADLE